MEAKKWDIAEELIGDAVGRGMPGTLLMIRIEGLDAIKELGDEAMQAARTSVMEQLNNMVRGSDIVGAMNENTCVLYYQRSQPADFLASRRDIIQDSMIEAIKPFGEVPKATGISVGAVRVPDEGRSFQGLCRKAEVALSDMKEEGILGFRMFISNRRPMISEEDIAPRLSLMRKEFVEWTSSKGAYEVRSNEFYLFYQFCQRLCPDVQVCAGMVLFTVEDNLSEDDEPIDLFEMSGRFYELLKTSLRKKDIVSKFSSNEFLVIYTAQDDRGLHQAVERILELWKVQPDSDKTYVNTEMLLLTGEE